MEKVITKVLIGTILVIAGGNLGKSGLEGMSKIGLDKMSKLHR